MYTGEAFFAIVLAGLATAIATGTMTVPNNFLHSSVTQTFLLIMALVLFAYSPVVGIAAIALFAVMLYNRNIQKTSFYQKAATQMFGQETIARERVPYVKEAGNITSHPRQYTKFEQDTFQEYKEMKASDAIGQYPIHEERHDMNEPVDDEYLYRPGKDMGSNTFHRFGPAMDNKMSSFAY